jgi:hypothetical protein
MEEFSLDEPAYHKLRERIDERGLAKAWQQVEDWASQGENVFGVYLIYDTLESAWCSMLDDHYEREFIEQVAGRAKDSVRDLSAKVGGVAVAEAIRKQFIAAIDRIEQEGLFGYDAQIRQAERHLVAVRRIFKEQAEPPDIVKDALARRKKGRPRQSFNRAAVEKALREHLKLIAPKGETSAKVRDLVIRLLMGFDS